MEFLRGVLYVRAMDIGLTPQERMIVRLARRKRLCPENRALWVVPWWFVALLALTLMMLVVALACARALMVMLVALWW